MTLTSDRIGRRRFAALSLTGLSALSLLGPAALGPAALLGGRAARAEEAGPWLNDDGLYEQPFFIQSFLDLSEDLQTAADAGRRLAVMWELKGCPYCKETHLVNFADPEIRGFVEGHFDILQLNLIGSRLVTDFDGEELSEKALARKWGVRFTPTTIYFPESLEQVGERPGQEAEVARMPGYFRPPHFLAMYRYVADKAYESVGFKDYLKAAASG